MPASTVQIVIQAVNQASGPITQVNASLQGMNAHAQNASKGLNQMGGHLGKVASLAEGVLIGMLAFQALRLPGQIISTAVEAYAAFERLQLTLKNLLAVEVRQKNTALTMSEAMSQVAGRSEELINFTQELAILSPFTQETVANILQTAMGYGMASGMAQKLTQTLADFAAGTGKSEDQTRMLGLALGQVWAKGKLTGEEVRQLTNAGMGVEIMAKAAGLEMNQFAKVMETGAIDAKVLIPRLIELSDARFAGAAKAQATTWAGLLSTMQDIVKIGLRTYFEDTLKAIQPALAGFVDEWPRWRDELAKAGQSLAGFVANSMRAIGDLRNAFKNMSDQSRDELIGLGVLLAVGPIITGAKAAYYAVLAIATAFKRMRMMAIIELIALSAAYDQTFGRIDAALGKHTKNTKQLLEGMGQGVEDLLAGVGAGEISFEGAMDAIRGAGVNTFDDIGSALRELRAEFNRPLVDMPALEELEAAFAKLYPNKMGPASMQGLIRAYEELNHVIIKLPQAIAEVGNGAEKSYSPIAQLGEKLKDTAGSIRSVIASTSEMISYLISIDPAARAAAAAVETLKLRITGLQDQQAGLQESIRASQAVLKGLQDQVNGLESALSAAKQRLTDLASPQLKGMGAMDEQIFQIQQQIKRLKLEEMGLDSSAFAAMTEEAKAFAATLPTSIEELEDMLEALGLQKSLEFDELLRKIAEEAKGAAKELTFEEAIAQIRTTKAEIGNLEGSLATARDAAAAQAAAIESMQAAAEAMTKAIQQMQADLKIQEERQNLVNDALKIAYDWFINDREKLMDMGGEAVTQAGIIDDATRDLLSLTSQYAQGEAGAAITAIEAALNAYRLARVEMAGGLFGTESLLPSIGGATPELSAAPQNVVYAGSQTAGYNYYQNFSLTLNNPTDRSEVMQNFLTLKALAGA